MKTITDKCHICGENKGFTIADNASLLREATCLCCGASIRNSDLIKCLLNQLNITDPLQNSVGKLNNLKILNCSAGGIIHENLKKLENYYCFEYFDDIAVGEYKNGIICNDLQNLTYDANFFDVVISEDVFEHVKNHEKALREIFRVLVPNGFHVFTVPVHENAVTKSRAHKEPIYHGDPIRGDGVLVCNDFGHDVAEILSFDGFKTDLYCMHRFYAPNEITDVDIEYQEYLSKEHIDFFRYNSNVLISKKSDTNILSVGFTGERMIPGLVDEELELEHRLRYSFAEQFVSGKRVLDAACGSGYGSQMLARTAKHVTGIDISSEAIIHANEFYKNSSIDFYVGSVEKLDFPNNSFDVVISFETLEHVPENIQNSFLKEIKRVLTNDGLLVMSTPNHEIYKERGENHFHIKELNSNEFVTILSDKFQHINLYNQSYETTCFISSDDKIDYGKILNNTKQAPEYMVAVCSDKQLEKATSFAAKKVNGSHNNLLSWAVSLHEEDIKKNRLIEKQSNEIASFKSTMIDLNNAKGHIDLLIQSERELKQEVLNKTGHVELLIQSERDLNHALNLKNTELETYKQDVLNRIIFIENSIKHDLTVKTNLIAQYEQDILKKEQNYQHEISYRDYHIEQLENNLREHEIANAHLLNEKDALNAEIARITSSRSFRLMTKGWAVRRALLPVGSLRAKVAGKGYRFLRHPVLTLKNRAARRKEQAAVRYDKLVFAASTSPVVSIIIPVYNQFEMTYPCLKSILENTGDVNYEIIIADDCSTDTTKKIEKLVRGITVVRNTTNLRFLLNCNNAAKHAKGQYILFLNNDTQVKPNWLKPLVDLIESDDIIGMVGSKLLYPDGTLQEAGGIMWTDASAWNYGNRQDPALPQFNYVKEADYISGASLMIDKKLWNDIGGFDESFAPAYYEDSDLAFEVRKRGYKVMYQPLSEVVHFEGASNGTDTTQGQKAYQVANAERFYSKWKDTLQKEHFVNAENVFLAKDRARDKKTILVIDHYIPTYDKDAGSRTIDQYLELLVELGYNVKFLGDNFHYDPDYAPRLEQRGIEVLCGVYYRDHWKEYMLENIQSIDFVYLNRPHIAKNYIDFFKKHSKAKILYYGLDLHFLRLEREYEVKKDSQILKAAVEIRKTEFDIIDKSDVFITISNDEKSIIDAEFGAGKSVVTPIYCYKSIPNNDVDFSGKKNIIFVGGFTHTPNVDGVLWFTEKIWPQIKTKSPDAKFIIIGSNPPSEVQSLASEDVTVTGFVSDEELQNYYDTCRVCVVPLRYGAGVKGKTIEAMYQAVPIVSTSIGIEGLEDIEGYITSYDDEKSIADRVNTIFSDDKLSVDLAKKARDYIKEKFSYETAKQLFKDLFS